MGELETALLAIGLPGHNHERRRESVHDKIALHLFRGPGLIGVRQIHIGLVGFNHLTASGF
jgi:hypothetical protein